MGDPDPQLAAIEPRLFAFLPRARGEEARRWLIEHELLDVHARILSESNAIFFPLGERAVGGATSGAEAAEGCGPGDDGQVDAGNLNPPAQNFATHFGAKFVVRETEVRTRDRGSFQVLAQVPEEARAKLPQGFDQVGDIAVVKFGDENRQWEAETGRAILAAFKGLRVVAADDGVTGEMRLRALRKIAGGGPLTTVHREFGIAIEVDLEKVFFTPRLAGERRRVALLVAPYERVLDAFAGVGPISLHIAKAQPGAEIDAIDINPTAVELIRRNAERNKLKNIRARQQEFGAWARAQKPHSYSRIVMNLPHRAREFLPAALPLVAPGGLVHLYAILPLEQILPEQGQLRRLAEQAGAKVTILRARPIKTYSPNDLYVVFDLRVDEGRGRTQNL
jgi:tRNA (guanine37-N1)-methyltransferase